MSNIFFFWAHTHTHTKYAYICTYTGRGWLVDEGVGFWCCVLRVQTHVLLRLELQFFWGHPDFCEPGLLVCLRILLMPSPLSAFWLVVMFLVVVRRLVGWSEAWRIVNTRTRDFLNLFLAWKSLKSSKKLHGFWKWMMSLSSSILELCKEVWLLGTFLFAMNILKATLTVTLNYLDGERVKCSLFLRNLIVVIRTKSSIESQQSCC